MRLLLVLALGLTAVLPMACVRQRAGTMFHRPTGTCGGACAHYLACKAERGHEVNDSSRRTCELECAEVFSGVEALVAFESLSCEDAIAFVEGKSGRGPGTLLSDAPGAEPAQGARAPNAP